MKKSSRSVGTGVVALAALLLLSGCGGVAGAALVPSAEPDSTSATADADSDDDANDPTERDDADAGAAGADLTFAAGRDLDSAESPQLGTDSDGNEWMLSVRAFAKPMAGLYTYVSCAPDADSAAVFTDVIDHVSIFPSLG